MSIISSHVDPTSFELRRILPASRDRVFAAWIKKEQLEQWMCKDSPSHQAEYVELNVREGGRYVIEIKMPEGYVYRGSGIFQEVRAPEKLVFTWFWERVPAKENDPPLQQRESLVTVQLFERGSSTEIVLTHELLANETARRDSVRGWEGCLAVLKTVLESQP
jgi:uncharacterized protein YndB with AHSA1/START domain